MMARRTGRSVNGVTNKLPALLTRKKRSAFPGPVPGSLEGEVWAPKGSVGGRNAHGACPAGKSLTDEQEAAGRGPEKHTQLSNDGEGETGLGLKPDDGREARRARLIHAEPER